MSSAGPTIFWRRSCKIRPCRRRERRAPRPRGPALFSDQRVGQLRSFGTAPNLTFAPLEVRIIILAPGIDIRSEEHPSELQSLMRISYAVFCLKKKKHKA